MFIMVTFVLTFNSDFFLLFSAPFACFVMAHACLTPVNKGVAGIAEIYDI